MNGEHEPRAPKKAYKKPALTMLGRIESLTLGRTGAAPDGMSGMAML
jgi:hypothetical protein